MPQIHPTAIIEAGALIGEGTTIGPYCVIGPRVVIGHDNRIGPHVVIEGRTVIGNSNQIYQFASVGSPPQDLKYRGEETLLEIGDENAIREYVTLQPGTEHGVRKTVIGSRNLFMACSHVGHDAVIGSNNVFANSAALAGHVSVGDNVTVGGLCGIHQFVRIGDFAFLGGGTMASRDIVPFCLAHGDHAELNGINRIGLERAGFAREDILRLRQLYRRVFRGGAGFQDRVSAAREEYSDLVLGVRFLDFIQSESRRGFAFPRRRTDAAERDENQPAG